MAIVINGQTKLTYAEYVLFPDDGRRHELVDGEHVVTPAPGTYHQKVSRKILVQLYRQIEETGRGEVHDAPTDLHPTKIDVVQPDLIVEILSSPTAKNDRELKLALYHKTGVPEYWIVDPADRVIEQYLLDGDTYRLAGKHAESIAFRQLEDVVVDLTRVW